MNRTPLIKLPGTQTGAVYVREDAVDAVSDHTTDDGVHDGSVVVLGGGRLMFLVSKGAADVVDMLSMAKLGASETPNTMEGER